MNIALKVGESGWFKTRCGERALVFNTGVGVYPLTGARGGIAYIHECWTSGGFASMRIQPHSNDLVEHLPDCTGWDWKPKAKLQLIADQLRKEIDVLRYSTFDEKKASCSRLGIIADELDAMEATK